MPEPSARTLPDTWIRCPDCGDFRAVTVRLELRGWPHPTSPGRERCAVQACAACGHEYQVRAVFWMRARILSGDGRADAWEHTCASWGWLEMDGKPSLCSA